MATYGTPPPELSNAIQSSSAKFGVPVDILTGVWRRESGSSFPNNFVNASGYGGLFGTTNWNGSTQSQSDYAASILAHLKSQYGNWSTALYHYSGGAYTSVPGQTTSGGAGPSIPIISGVAKAGQAAGSALDIPSAINNFSSAITNLPNTIIQDFKGTAINSAFIIIAIGLFFLGGYVLSKPYIDKKKQQALEVVGAIPK